MIKGMIVHDPRSVVLVDNASRGTISLPRDGKREIILPSGQTTQLTWAEFVHFKSIPGFGHKIKLNDSVVISEGHVKIKNVSTSLNDDYMIGILVQSLTLIKEFILSLNEADRVVFSNFLETRKNLGIEPEKCQAALDFISTNYGDPEEVSTVPEIKEDTTEPVKRGRPKVKKEPENKEDQ